MAVTPHSPPITMGGMMITGIIIMVTAKVTTTIIIIIITRPRRPRASTGLSWSESV